MEVLKNINVAISIVFTLCYFYQFVYILVQLLLGRRKSNMKDAVDHSFAVLICARNESTVITELIDSIKKQTYSQSLIKTFVMADNCTDDTAALAAKAGAVVYEKNNLEKVGKGYALEELLKFIKRDFGDFDGYFVFDADNILDKNFISEMNKTFSQGYEIVTSYRNSKNYGDNWISAGYALWFLRESRYLNEARMILNTSCAVSGTGFMFSKRILEKNGGWPFHLLTEDIEFSVKQVIDGEKIGFCKDAVLYDEQPVNFVQSWNQRLRWSKGFLQVFKKYGKDLIKGMFKGSFACFDMGMVIMPAFLLTFLSILVNTVLFICGLFGICSFVPQLHYLASTIFNAYGLLLLYALLTTVSEWKKIYAPTWKKIIYNFTFPIFIFTYIPISVVAVFKKVSWKPIKHDVSGKSLERVTDDGYDSSSDESA